MSNLNALEAMAKATVDRAEQAEQQCRLNAGGLVGMGRDAWLDAARVYKDCIKTVKAHSDAVLALIERVRLLRGYLIAAVNATDGGCNDDVSDDFLSHLATEVAAIKAQRNELRAALPAAPRAAESDAAIGATK